MLAAWNAARRRVAALRPSTARRVGGVGLLACGVALLGLLGLGAFADRSVGD